MEFLYFTIAGLVLYGVSDLILNKIENARGERFPNRSLIFLIIIMLLALGSFSLIDHLTNDSSNPSPTAVETTTDQKTTEGGKK